MERPRIQIPEWLGRLPLVSVGLAALWLGLAMLMGLGFSGELREAQDELNAAARFAIQHPDTKIHPRLLPVARDLMPGFESNEMFAFLRDRSDGEGSSQALLDGLAARSLALFDAHPTRVLGIVPLQFRSQDFFTHAFVHGGLVHALLTAFVFLLSAPLLEGLWGRRIFVPALVLMALGGSSAFFLAFPDSDRALLGGGALAAGVTAAVLARQPTGEVDFLAWFAPAASARLQAPAWSLLGVWGLYELLIYWSVPIRIPGLGHALGFVAHAGGALVGIGVALSVKRLGWEVAPSVTRARSARPRSFQLEAVTALCERGEPDAAFEMLEQEVRRSARHRNAVTLYFEMCCEREEPERAVPAMAQLVREELRRGAAEQAVARWRDLVEHVPGTHLDPASLIEVAAALQRSSEDEMAVVAVQQLLGAEALSAQTAVQAAELAADLTPDLAAAAARVALETEGLDAGARARIEALARAASGDEEKPDESPVPRKGTELPPNVFYEGQDRSAFGQVDDLSAEADFPAGAVTEAVPRSLDLEAVVLAAGEQGEQRIDFERVRAISVVGVHGLGPKPVLLIDMLVDGRGTERPLSAFRLRSDRFDPRMFAPGSTGGVDALRVLVVQLLAGSEALPLPDPESAVLKPPKMFPSLEAYESEVLTAVGRDLA